MTSACSSAEITAPRALAASVPYAASVVLSAGEVRRMARAVSLSVDGILVLSPLQLRKGQPVWVSLPGPGGQQLELSAVVAHESTHLARRALDLRFVNLVRGERLLLEGLVSQPGQREPTPPARQERAQTPRRSTTIAPQREFDGLPSTDELDALLASTLAELQHEGDGRNKKRKRRFRW